MDLEINKLIDSEFIMLNKLGWLLFHRNDLKGGLDANELNELLKIVNEGEMESVYTEGFNEGLDY